MAATAESPVYRWFLLFLLPAAACSGREVQIRVVIPGPDSADSPVARLPLIALPYDRDSVLSALEARAPTPRPHSAALDSLFEVFRRPFQALAEASLRVQALGDTLATLKQRLDTLPRGAPAYRAAYLRFAALSDSLGTAQAAAARAQTALDKVRKAVEGRIEKLRGEVRRWENNTYQPYDSIVRTLSVAVGRQAIADTTGADGRTTLRLPPGRWWIYARSWDASDPNAEWYWNLPVTGADLVLDRTTGRRRPRY